MPRLPPALIRQAASENPLLPHLLRVCRDLPSARNELRWLHEYAHETVTARSPCAYEPAPSLDQLTSRKSRYILRGPFNFKRGRRPSPRTSSRSLSRNIKSRPAPLVPSRAVNADGNGKPFDSAVRESLSDAAPRGLRPSPDGTTKAVQNAPDAPVKKTLLNAIRQDYAETRDESAGSRSQYGSVRKGLVWMILVKSVAERSRGKPLQYIIGNQPFGTLDIACREGVLIPRPETETYTSALVEILLSLLSGGDATRDLVPESKRRLRILDLCSGSGCIALLLHSILKPPGGHLHLNLVPTDQEVEVDILGVDKNEKAIRLGRHNLLRNLAKGLLHEGAAKDVSFTQLDVLSLAKKASYSVSNDGVLEELNAAALLRKKDGERKPRDPWDVIVSNPPYISPKDYDIGGKTEPSVRNYEPKSALVPPPSDSDAAGLNPSPDVLGDVFYSPLLRIAHATGAKILVMEVGDSAQAGRVYHGAIHHHGSVALTRNSENHFECWSDDGSVRALPEHPSPEFDFAAGTNPEVSDRALVLWTGALAKWRRLQLSKANEAPTYIA